MELELGLALPYHNPNPNPNASPTTACSEEMETWKEAPHPYHCRATTKHVKVKMEGVAIGRKVDLRNCASYHALTHTLIHMFAKYSDIERNWEEYSLLYQDKEGDWMLLGEEDHAHVQWEVFVDSVQRIHILLNNDNNNNNMGFRLLSHK